MSDFVFNNSSLVPQVTDPCQIIAPLAEMLNAMACIEDALSNKPNFRINNNPWEIVVAETHGSTLTLGDAVGLLFRSNHIEEGDYFNSLILMAPSWSDLNENILDAIIGLEPLTEDPGSPDSIKLLMKAGEEALICAITNYILTSLPRGPEYKLSNVSFICRNQRYNFDHAYDMDSALIISERIRSGALQGLTARNFPEEKFTIFPNLLFGQEVDDLILRFPSIFLKLLFTRLQELDSASKMWFESGDYPHDFLELSSESDFTMSNYGSQRIRKGHDGTQRTFEEHVWVSSGTRIHLFRHDELRTIEIGYLGPHLDTQRH